MNNPKPLATEILFSIGPIPISTPVVTTWAIMLVLSCLAWATTRRCTPTPKRAQLVAEIFVETLSSQIREVVHRDPAPFLPLLGTLFLYIAVANLVTLLPGLEAPTAHLETAAALALIVYLAAHVQGIRARGLYAYLKSYVEPTPLLLPLNILSELTRSFSLTIRLFGNIMSHELVLAIVLSLAGLLVPVPLMALGALIGLVQAYIFTILATVAIGGAVGSVEKG